MGDGFEIYTHNIRKKENPESIVSNCLELFNIFKNSIETFVQVMREADILIIHKFIMPLDNTIIERMFLQHDTVVYSVYDAEYIANPTKSAFLFSESDLVHAISHSIAAHAREYTEDVAVIPPSVDTDFFKPMREGDIKFENSQINPSDKFVIGWVGNASDHKENIEHMIDTLPEENSSETIFRLLCGGELPAGLKQKIERISIETEIIEWVPRKDVPKVINTFDVGLAPLQDTAFNRGRSSEKIREYMSCGCPVIASDIGENRYLVPESAGFLADDSTRWEEALHFLINNPEKRQEMGEHAREYMESNYSITAVSEKIKTQFERLD
jgi:glycosyltransferase involved in cell wall biosynthesis